MKQTLTTEQAISMLIEDENANWTYWTARALVEYYENLEEDLGEDLDFEVCAIRCDFSAYDDLQDWAKDYFSGDWKKEICEYVGLEYLEDEELDEAIREYIRDHGDVLETGGHGVVVSSF